jgi:hypothetical protein
VIVVIMMKIEWEIWSGDVDVQWGSELGVVMLH